MIISILLFFLVTSLFLLVVNWIMEYKDINTLCDFNYKRGFYHTAERILSYLSGKLGVYIASMLYGLTYSSFSIYGQPYMIVADPKLSHEVMNKINKKSFIYSTFNPIMEHGLLTVNNLDLWKSHKRFLAPAFNMPIMGQKYIDIINSSLKGILQDLHGIADRNEEITSWAHTFKWQMRFVSRAIMRVDIDPTELEYLHYWTDLIHDSVAKRFFSLLRVPSILNRIYEYILGYRQFYNYYNNMTRNILLETRKIKDGNHSRNMQDSFFINLLASEKSNLIYSHENLLQEIITFFEAGGASMGTTFNYILLMLAIHTDAQEKVHKEILDVLGDDDFINTAEQLDKLLYLQNCINETFRRFTPVPVIMRQAEKDTKLKDGRIIPKNTAIFLSIYHMHQNENLYPYPQKWDPNRFDESEIKKRNPASFQPFASGPRKCIGYKLAYMSLKTQLAAILKQFRITTNLTYSEIEDGVYLSTFLKNTCRFSLIYHRRN